MQIFLCLVSYFLFLGAISMISASKENINWHSSVEKEAKKLISRTDSTLHGRDNTRCYFIPHWFVFTLSYYSYHVVVWFCHFPVTTLLLLEHMDYLHLWCIVVRCGDGFFCCCCFWFSVNFIVIHRNDRINVDYTMFYQFMVLNFKIAGVKSKKIAIVWVRQNTDRLQLAQSGNFLFNFDCCGYKIAFDRNVYVDWSENIRTRK